MLENLLQSSAMVWIRKIIRITKSVLTAITIKMLIIMIIMIVNSNNETQKM